MWNSFLMKGKDLIVGMFFPKVPDVQISTLTFNKHPSKAGIYCEELKTLFDTSFNNAEQLKTIFEVSFGKDSHKTSCLILLHKYWRYDFLIPLNLLTCLKNWFPYARTSIWGGVVQKLSVCNMVYNSHVCKNNVECVVISISGTEMQTWPLCLDRWCDTEKKIEDKFKVFKDGVKFKKHSIGLMFTSDIRGSYLYNLESTIFKKFFPGVPLIEYFGNNAFGGELSEVTYERLEAVESVNTTAFMILTYN
ncbi:F-box only protein 22-like isoform X1 [Vespula squamosa]|uniref:F-box only protein 22-like isoform X1 n=1 Tax=Vespula squamosa TaxID=30214 RepID=A0ABD1ZTY4_VESSQ